MVITGVADIFFFFQAEDGIRDLTVTGVQTCALPISISTRNIEAIWLRVSVEASRPKPVEAPLKISAARASVAKLPVTGTPNRVTAIKIGRASCRERV